MAKKKENYLDFVPAVNGQNTWARGEDGKRVWFDIILT